MKSFYTSMVAAVAALSFGAVTAYAQAPAPAAPAAPTSKTLEQVKARGVLVCGSNTGLAGFGMPDDKGNWTGLDVDLCRALAAAIFNDPNKVRFVPLSAKDRFTALQSGEIDVLSRNGTWTISREADLGLLWAGVNYYDGQAFMVRKKLNINSALELSGASVCVQQGTTTETNLADFFRANNMKYEPAVYATLGAPFFPPTVTGRDGGELLERGACGLGHTGGRSVDTSCCCPASRGACSTGLHAAWRRAALPNGRAHRALSGQARRAGIGRLDLS